MNLLAVSTFRVPARIVKDTETALRKAGRDGCELFVLWSGRASDSVFEVLTPHVPEQTSYRTRTGLSVRVEGSELHRLNAWLFEAEETIAVQVHAHPDYAYHSEVDNTYPIMSTLGGLSIVASEFCSHGLMTDATATYRLDRNGWKQQPNDMVKVF